MTSSKRISSTSTSPPRRWGGHEPHPGGPGGAPGHLFAAHRGAPRRRYRRRRHRRRGRDSGTSWEMGYAYALKKKVVALRTDFRIAGHHERVNLMLEESAGVVTRKEDLPPRALGSPLPASG
ncbi:nucleoside 2-deoxyribosyltransferase [Methanoculleus chikugoensis]|uniref:nucleoside 2-deoxyribosyltransferase n=1 Tax=Methanoculleus chikugoensis TaxID=118126 RepID=UPI001FB321D2|nr:nucleoside 2-deoxyribosyltransferase [Methanoculleus chikugoensis]